MTKCYIKNYPRPQFVRPKWQSLDGEWDFTFDDSNAGLAERWHESFPKAQKITVPFSYETSASGIGDEKYHPVVWYSKTIEKPADWENTLVHFEGCDYDTTVWLNGQCVGQHTGGYTRFSFDLSPYITDGDNTLVVRAADTLDMEQMRGKQRWKSENFGCWYVQTTGIWKSVWLESVPAKRLAKVRMTPSIQEGTLTVEWQVDAPCYGKQLELSMEVTFGDIYVNATTVPVIEKRGSATIQVTTTRVEQFGLQEWTPSNPALYDISFALKDKGVVVDEVGSYFGMREVATKDGKVLLNGRPLYQRMILDQGYWHDSHLTPPSEQALIDDIDKTLEMGFNGARKHQKVEDERYFYWCDVKGLLTWCEAPSTYSYNSEMAAGFTAQWQDIVEQHYNHPSIVTWTPINESWGVPKIKDSRAQQHFSEAIYHLTKAVDMTRPVIVNDGWEHTVSDIITLHDYEEGSAEFLARYASKNKLLYEIVYHNTGKSIMARGFAYKGQPILISEYGGAAYERDAEGPAWGYGNGVATEEALLARIDDMTTAIKQLPYVHGYCYTQLTDVQQEVNGLLTEQREYKANKEAIREINLRKIEQFKE